MTNIEKAAERIGLLSNSWIGGPIAYNTIVTILTELVRSEWVEEEVGGQIEALEQLNHTLLEERGRLVSQIVKLKANNAQMAERLEEFLLR